MLVCVPECVSHLCGLLIILGGILIFVCTTERQTEERGSRQGLFSGSLRGVCLYTESLHTIEKRNMYNVVIL